MAKTARETAVSEGCPEDLFTGLCEWLAPPGTVVQATNPDLRFDANTRARALQAWRRLRVLRMARTL